MHGRPLFYWRMVMSETIFAGKFGDLIVADRFDYEGDLRIEIPTLVTNADSYISRETIVELRDHLNKVLGVPVDD